jgi:catalase
LCCFCEQAAFCPATVVPGIDFTADKLLQGRIFSYADTKRHRLGANYLRLPTNRPQSPVDNNQRDGATQYAPDIRGTVNHEPNALAGGAPNEAPAAALSADPVKGDVGRQKISLTNDFAQAGARHRSLKRTEQEHLVGSTADSSHAERGIQRRVAENLNKADPELGTRVSRGLRVNPPGPSLTSRAACRIR